MGKKILLVESDNDYLQVLVDYVCRMNIFDGYAVATDGAEAIRKAEEFLPDVVVTSLVLPTIDGLGVISELSKKLKGAYFIVSTAIKNNYVIEVATNKGASLYFAKPTEFSVFQDRIEELLTSEHGRDTIVVKNEDLSTMAAITKEIQKIGLSPGVKGFRYVRHAIYLMMQGEGYKSMMKEIYPEVAKKFNTSPTCVERDIRHAIEGAWIHGSMQYIDEAFGFSVDADKGKPTNTAFIVTIAERIRLGL